MLMIDAPALPHPVYVDRDMWEKVVLNLLSNAFKFTFEGEIGVAVKAAADGNHVEISVRDTGTGIPAAELPHLFERFRRVDGARGRSYEGSGIGLALVQELVKLHGGDIRVESKPDRGSVFTITIPFGASHLPAGRLNAAGAQASTNVRAQAYVDEAIGWLDGGATTDTGHTPSSLESGFVPAETSMRRDRVLLADDNPDMRDYVRRLLARHYDVEAVSDGQAALEAAWARRPDLVLSDIMMPRLDGLGLLKALRSDQDLRDVPVIFLSARAGEEAKVEGLEAGADDYLSKPFSARELLARVRANIEMAHLRRRTEDMLRGMNERLEVQVSERAAELQAKEARLRTIFETSYIYQSLLATDGAVLDANATSLSGIDARLDQVIGMPFWETPWFAGTPGMPEMVRAAVAAVAGGETMRTEIHLNLPVGGWRWFDFQMRPVHDDGGQVVAIVPEAVELTERRQAEEAFRQAQKMEAIGQLTGGVAHDFNNLLTVIRSSADLLRRRDLPADRMRRYVDAISDTADRAAKLTGQLLTFARRQALSREVFDIADQLDRIADMLKTVLGSSAAMHLDIAERPLPVEADVNQFETALVNLVANARDAMGGSGESLTIRAARLRLDPLGASRHAVDEFVTVSVSDNGCGIPADQIDRIFEPFFTTKEIGRGTGLGLSQVYGFAHQSGGTVRVESEVGRGTTLTLQLPLSFKPVLAQRGHSGKSAAADERWSVLVVEDNAEVGEFSTQLLGDLGYQTVLARNAQEALNLLDEDAGRFDIVLSDVVMPGIDGVALGREVRRRLPHLPFVLNSGYSHVLADDESHGFELIHKPYSVEELSRVLRRAMANRLQVRRKAGSDS